MRTSTKLAAPAAVAALVLVVGIAIGARLVLRRRRSTIEPAPVRGRIGRYALVRLP